MRTRGFRDRSDRSGSQLCRAWLKLTHNEHFRPQLRARPHLPSVSDDVPRMNPASARHASDPASLPAWAEGVIDTLPYGLGLFDTAQRLVRWNPRFQALLRLPADALASGRLEFTALVELTRRGANPAAQAAGLMLMDGRAGDGPRKVERLMGDGILLEVHVAPLPDGGMAMTLHDITMARQTADALRRSRAQNELLMTQYRQVREGGQRASQGRQRSGAELAQALRAPIAAIASLLPAQDDDASLDDRGRERLDHARRATATLGRAVEDMTAMAALEADKSALQAQSFVLEAVLRELAASSGQLARPGQELAFDLDPGLPMRVIGDEHRLRQLLLQLTSTALRWVEGAPVVVRIDVQEQTDVDVALDVSVGTGGMAPASPSSPASGAASTASATTTATAIDALGLGGCRDLLRLMGAELQLHGQGADQRASFRLRLALDRAAALRSVPLAAQGLQVLVADSRPNTRRALARIARGLGWEVAEAASSAEMLDQLHQSRRLAAVLVHAQLDDAAAFDAALRAADAVPGRPLAVVAHGDVAGVVNLVRLGDHQRRRIGAYLAMPATASLLAEAVEQAQRRLQPGKETGEAVQGNRPLHGLRVLLAEDNESNQIVTRDLLLAQGAQVEIAVDGLDTLTSIVANGRYDAILMDWEMPNMDGLEATREIRQIVGFKDVPIIALTSNASAADRAACLDAGMNAHLGKPVDANELVATVLRHARPGANVEAPRTAADAAPARAQARKPGAPVRIERDAALARLGGDASLYAKVLDRFRTEVPRTLAALDEASQRSDRKEAYRLAHTLKGNAGTVGAQQLADAARDAESAFRGTDTGKDKALLESLRQVAQATLRAIA